MESHKTLINKLPLKLIKEFAEDPQRLSHHKKLRLAEFLNQESDGIVSKELMLRCLEVPSEVTLEERSQLMQYQEVLVEALTSKHLSLERRPSKSKHSDSSDVSRVTDEDSGEVKKILGALVDDALQDYPDLIPILQEAHGTEDHDQKNAATSDNIGTLANQDDEIG